MNRTVSDGYRIRYGSAVDIGRSRASNQDELILSPENGFFGVSDGMGGLTGGGLASKFVAEAMPVLMDTCRESADTSGDIDLAAADLRQTVAMLSDRLFEETNTPKHFACGATIAGVWIRDGKGIFVWLGDSRAYLLRKRKRVPECITEDMNLAAILVRNGDLTEEEAKNHPSSSKLTAFVGMQSPAAPETVITDLNPGDRLLVCSDGLYGLVPEREMARIMRSSRSPDTVCRRLVDKANEYGGRDNISAVYIHLKPESSAELK